MRLHYKSQNRELTFEMGASITLLLLADFSSFSDEELKMGGA